ncbi:MAG: leucine-rich repeat protein [Clostridia bacterium]|nr:leucine-rich repeat protein [Clostridia bacterium]
MAIFTCKRCGEPLDIIGTHGVCECKVCGAQQTVPRPTSDKIESLHGSAAQARKIGDFDGAKVIYNQILAETPDDPEVYWALVLCEYGVQYVIEPGTNKRVPTVNRTQITPVFDDDHYKLSMEYATEEQKVIYEADAKEIDDIQKGILEISSKEDPFDVFICYKESEDGVEPKQRTIDSVRAEEIYNALTKEGLKVFFARITLEDKLGTEYEPYIFSALNSARVMLAFGTKKEHFYAPWVRNEWSRYIALRRKDPKNKNLIAVYDDATHLPREFSNIQSQDMTKVGWHLDLVRGVKKFFDRGTTVHEVMHDKFEKAENEKKIKRAFTFLEDGDFEHANEYAEAVLDVTPEYAEAYLIKLLVELKIKKAELLKSCTTYIGSNFNYLKACQYAPDDLLKSLHRYEKATRDNSNNQKAQELFTQGCQLMEKELYYDAIKLFESVGTYSTRLKIDDKLKACKEHFNAKYYDIATHSIDDEDYARAITYLKLIGDHSDSKKKLAYCERMMNEVAYKAAVNLMDRGAYSEAIKGFEKIAEYKDSAQKIRHCKDLISEAMYKNGLDLMNKGAFNDATSEFEKITNYKDAEKRIKQCRELAIKTAYKEAVDLMKDGLYGDAITAFEKIADYKNASKLIGKCKRLAASGKGPKKKRTHTSGKKGNGVKKPNGFLRFVVFALIAVGIGFGFTYLKSHGYFEPDAFEYTEIDGGVILTGVKEGADVVDSEGLLKIPQYIKGQPVLRIDDNAFEYNRSIYSLVIPDGIVVIGQNAFGNCSNINSVIIGNTVTKIHTTAFLNTNISSITAPLKAFEAKAIPLDNVSHIEITKANGVIPEGIFNYKTFSTITLSSDVTGIAPGAFAYCSNIATVTIPGSVETIGAGAFQGCYSLTSLTIEEGVKRIEALAFYGCNNLSTLTIPSSAELVDPTAFNETKLYTVTLPAEFVGSISKDYLSEVTITSGEIPEGAFAGGGLSTVILNDGVTKIGAQAFAYNYNISSITIPATVTEIADDAFVGCGITNATLPISFAGVLDKYALANVTLVGDGSIPADAFKNCRNLTSITFENCTVSEIGASAFENCTSLTEFAIPDGVGVIGDNAFKGCSALRSVSIPSSVSSIGSYAFYECAEINTLTLPDGLEVIGSYAFCGCGSLMTIQIPASVNTVGEGALSGCDALMVINCKASSQPDGWAENWTDSPEIVNWGY